jgi:AraC family transcriptional regulator
MSWKLRRAIHYVEVQLAEPLRSYQLAKVAGLSKAHFSRSFKATTGLTPSQFVMNRRLDRAVELLSSSDKSLTDIAVTCGFSDQSHFGRVFKRTLGLTPGAWRRSRMRADDWTWRLTTITMSE